MYYNQIIDNDEQLVYSLIKLFIDRNVETIRQSEIRENLQISSHKLLHLLEITENLAERLETFSISINKKECTFKTTSTFSLQDIYTEIVKTSVSFKLLTELLNARSFSLEIFAQKNYMSTRTIYRKISGLSSYLDNYHLKLNLRRKYPLSGAEYFLRYFYHLLYWQIYGPAKKYDQLTSTQISELEQSIIKNYPYFRKIDRSRWLHYFDLTLKRVRNGFYLDSLPEEITNFKNICIGFATFKEQFIIDSIFPNKLNQRAKENEAVLLYYLLSMMTTYSFAESEVILTKTQIIADGTEKIVKTFIEVLEKLFNVQLTTAERLFLSLNLMIIHSKSHVYATKNKTDIFGMRTFEIKLAEFFPAYYYKVKIELLQSASQSSFKRLYQENERLFFQYCMLIREILENHQSISFNIFLQSKLGNLQEEWQKRRVKDVINSDICIQFVEDEQKADLILTDYVDIERTEKDKYYHWQTNPNAKDWKYIVNYITQFQKKYLGF